MRRLEVIELALFLLLALADLRLHLHGLFFLVGNLFLAFIELLFQLLDFLALFLLLPKLFLFILLSFMEHTLQLVELRLELGKLLLISLGFFVSLVLELLDAPNFFLLLIKLSFLVNKKQLKLLALFVKLLYKVVHLFNFAVVPLRIMAAKRRHTGSVILMER
jgi:hypothetical protein